MASEMKGVISKTKEGLIPIAIMTEVGGGGGGDLIPSPQSIGVSPVASMMDPTSPQLSILSGRRNGEIGVHSAHDDITATLAAVAAGRAPSYASEIREVLSGLTVQSGRNGEISVHGPFDDVAVPAVAAVAVGRFSFEEEEEDEDMFSCAMFSPRCSGSCEDEDNDILPDYGDEVQVQVEPPLSPCFSGTNTTVVFQEPPPLSPTDSIVLNDPPPMLSPSSTDSMASYEEPLSPPMSPKSIRSVTSLTSPMSVVTSVVSNGTKAINDESKVASVKSLLIDSDEEDSHGDEDKDDDEEIDVETKNERRRKVQFVETNPTPLSPLSIHDEDFSPRSQKSDMESMLSPRNDDDETITLEGCSDDEDEPDWCDVNDDEGLLAKAKLGSTAGVTPRKIPKVPEIRDDESEASMMVLMRYMGCTPVAYGDGATLPHGAQWLDDTGSPSGRKFVFDSFDDNSLLSDEEYVDDEATYASNQQDALRTTWTYNEEGVEIGLEDLVLASPPMSPRYTDDSSVNLNSRKKGKSQNLTVDTEEASTTNPHSRKKGKSKKKKSTSPKSDRSDRYNVVLSDGEISDEEELLQPNLTVDTADDASTTKSPSSRKKGNSTKKKSTSPKSEESDRSPKSFLSDKALDKEAVMSDGVLEVFRRVGIPQTNEADQVVVEGKENGVLSDDELHAFLSDDEPAAVRKKKSSKKDGKSKAKKSNEKDPDAEKADKKKIAHKKSRNKDTNDADQEVEAKENAVLSAMVLSELELHASLSDDEAAAKSDKKTTSSRKDAKVKAKKSVKDPAAKKSKSSLKKSRNKDTNDRADQVEGNENADKATDRANEDAAIKKTTTSISSRRQVSSDSLAALDRYRKEKEVRNSSTPRSLVGTPRAGTPRSSSDKKAAIIAEKKTTADKKATVEKKADMKTDSAVKPTTKLDKKSSGSSMKEKKAVASSSSSGMEEKKSSGTSKKKKKVASSSGMEERKKVASPSREEQERVANSLLNKKKAKDASDKKTRVASNKSLEKKTVSSSEKREVASSDKKSKSTKKTVSASSSADSSKKKKKKVLAVAVEPQDQAAAVDNKDRPKSTKSSKPISQSSTMPIYPDLIGTYLSSPKTGVEKEPLISGLSQSALSPRQLATALSPRSTPVSSPTSVGNRAVPVVDTKDDVPSNNKEPKKEHVTSVSAMAAASIAAAEVSASKKKEHAASVSAMAAAAIAAAEVSASKKKEHAASVSAVASAMAAAAMAAAEISVSKSKFTSPPNKDDTALQDIGKLEESPTTRSDKENSSDSETSSDKATPPLMVVTASAATTSQAVPPASDSGSRTQQPRPALSPTKKSVRDVDELLSKTRNWLISHNESQLTKNQVPRTSSSSSSERRVMGNITAKTVLNSGNGSSSGGSGGGGNSSSSSAVSSTAALKVQGSSSKPLSSGLMDQRKLSGNATTTTVNTSAASILSSTSSSSSSSSMTGPKKSILEQLGEIRAKQRELELRQKAKQQRAK